MSVARTSPADCLGETPVGAKERLYSWGWKNKTLKYVVRDQLYLPVLVHSLVEHWLFLYCTGTCKLARHLCILSLWSCERTLRFGSRNLPKQSHLQRARSAECIKYGKVSHLCVSHLEPMQDAWSSKQNNYYNCTEPSVVFGGCRKQAPPPDYASEEADVQGLLSPVWQLCSSGR